MRWCNFKLFSRFVEGAHSGSIGGIVSGLDRISSTEDDRPIILSHDGRGELPNITAFPLRDAHFFVQRGKDVIDALCHLRRLLRLLRWRLLKLKADLSK